MSDIELQELVINEAESDEVVEQQTDLPPNQIIVTPTENIGESLIGLPVGAIFASAIPIVDARVHLLDGSLISQNGIYKEFAALIKTLISSGQPINCSQEEFDSDIVNIGNCGKFVVDDTNQTIRLPKITTFIQGLKSISTIGTSVKAGLPNIEGLSGGVMSDMSNHTFTGALYSGGAPRTRGWSGVDADEIRRIGFNASKYNSIYGNSHTVQPQATQFPYYIVLANGYKPNTSVNFEEFENELLALKQDINAKITMTQFFPIGSIFISATDGESPASRFGGTWERIENRFLVGAGSTYILGATGGSANAVVVSHNHGPGSLSGYYKMRDSDKGDGVWGAEAYYYSAHDTNSAAGAVVINSGTTSTTGESGTNKNLPPYLAVYIWKRIS